MTARRLRRLTALGALAFLAGALLLGLFPQEPLRRFAEARLRRAFGERARLAGLHVVPIRLAVDLEGLVLETATFSLEVARAHVELAAKLPGADAVALRTLEIQSPRLTLRPSQPDAAAPPAAPVETLPLLRIDTLTLRDGSLVLESASLPLHLDGVEAEGALGRDSLRLSARGGRIGQEPSVSLGPLRAVLRGTAEGDLSLEQSTLRVGDTSQAHATGVLVRRRALAPSLRFEGTLALAELAPLGLPEGTSGVLTAEGNASQPQGKGPALDAKLSGEQLSAAGWPLERLELEARYENGVAETTARLALFGGSAAVQARLADERVEGSIRADGLGLARIVRSAGGPTASGFDGRLSAEAHLSGPVSGSLSVDGRWSARGSLDGIPAWASEGTTQGAVAPRSGTYDLRWESTLTAASVASGDAIDLASLRSTLNGRAQSGTPGHVEARLEGEAKLRTPAAEAPLLFQADARADGALRSLSATARWRDSRLAAEARLQPERLEKATLRLEGLDLSALASSLTGTLEAEGEAAGALRAPGFKLSARGVGVAISGVSLGALAAELDGTPARARLTLTATEVPLDVEGTVALTGERQAQARVRLEAASLARLRPLWPELDLGGQLSAVLDVAIPLAQPESLRVQGQVTAMQASTSELRLSAARPFGIRYEDGAASVEDVELAGDGIQLSGRAHVDTRTTPLALEGATKLAVDLGSLPLAEGWRASGTARLDVGFEGSSVRPQLTGSVSLEELGLASPRTPELRIPGATLRLEGRSLEIEALQASLAGGELELSAHVPFASLLEAARDASPGLQDQERARIDLRWQGIDVAGLLASAGLTGTELSARLAGEAHVAGGLRSLAELEGRLSTPPLAARVGDLDVQLAPVDLRLSAGTARLAPLLITTAAGGLSVEGSADLVRSELDLTSRGRVELRALSPFMAEAAATGTGIVDVSLGGRFDDLRPRGSLRVEDGTLRLRLLRDSLTAIRGTLAFEGDTLRVEEMTGRFGGGAVSLSGGADVSGSTLRGVILQLTGRDVALRYPAGLRSRLDADLALSGDWGHLDLVGVARVQRGLYDLDVAFGETLRAAPVSAEPSALLQSIGLDVRVTLASPIAVRNSLADLRVDGSLDFRGDMNEPTPFGRLEIRPGGKVSLQQRAFEIESGRLVYDGTWDPGLDIRGRASITGTDPLGRRNDYRVTTTASGTLERPTLSFSSSPSLSENEIVSLIATGQTGAQALSAGAALAGEQAAALLTGQLTRGLSEGLKELGLDEVQIQPEIVARELTPGARFTFRKQLQRQAALTYSLSLKYPEQRFLQLDVKPGLGITAFGQQRDDGTSTLGFGQRFRLGGGDAGGTGAAATEAEPLTRLSGVQLEGVPAGVQQEWLTGQLRARAGRRVSAWELQEDADRLRDALRDRDYLEAEVSARLAEDSAVFELHPGPRYSYRVDGVRAPASFERELRGALYEDEALARGEALLARQLSREGHATVSVESEARDEEPGRRVLIFRVDPGPRFSSVRWSFPGAAALPERLLREAAGDPAQVLAAPRDAEARIRQAYAARHYLEAEAGPIEVARSPSTLEIRVPLREGPRARVHDVSLEGAPESSEGLLERAALVPGSEYDEQATAAAALRIRDELLSRGFPWARVVVRTRPVPPDVDVVFGVDSGRALRIGAVEIVGLRSTPESVVRSRLPFRVGEPLDPRVVQRAERDLLALGAFARVAITFSAAEQSTLRVEVVEDARFVASYDLRYNDEDKGQALVDAEARNLFGRGVVLGVRQGVSADTLETRASLSLPGLLGRGSFTASGFRIEEDIEGELGGTSLQRGAEIQRAQPLPGRLTLLAGYRFKRVSVADFEPVDVAGLDLSLYRDTRDSVLDARRGSFLSLNLQISPRKIGSDFDFLKGYLQAFFTTRLGEDLTWAQGYRLGMAHVYAGEPLVSSERFRGGGTNSVRGYDTDSLGPLGFLGDPAGGQAVLVLNQELRYHHRSGLGAAAFWDAGNVFAKTTDLSLDLRHALGLGLRYDSPVGLLRLDVGFPLNRREGDKAYRLHFSLGQAF